MALEIERAALEREKATRARRQRLPEVEREIAELQEQASAMKAQWQQRARADRAACARRRRSSSSCKTEAERLQRQGDFARASELRFGTIPQLEKRDRRRHARSSRSCAAAAASCARRSPRTTSPRWSPSGPASPSRRCSRARSSGCTKMEDRLRQRVVGQDEAVRPSPPRCAARAPASRIRTARSAASCSSGPTGVGKTELARALAEFLFDDEQRDDPHRHVASTRRSTRSRG